MTHGIAREIEKDCAGSGNDVLISQKRLGITTLIPMCEAPRDGREILAYQKDGQNFHPVKWKNHTWMTGGTEHWGMRWHEDYRQYDGDYLGWIPYPELVL